MFLFSIATFHDGITQENSIPKKKSQIDNGMAFYNLQFRGHFKKDLILKTHYQLITLCETNNKKRLLYKVNRLFCCVYHKMPRHHLSAWVFILPRK